MSLFHQDDSKATDPNKGIYPTYLNTGSDNTLLLVYLTAYAFNKICIGHDSHKAFFCVLSGS